MLRISGFTESGIHGSEVEGFGARGGALLVDHVEIQGEPGSVALRFQGRTRHVHVTASRILGPARAGLAVDGETYSLEVRETTFAFLDDAVRFEGRDHVRSRCVLANNTFYKVKRGIVFTHMPARSGTALTIVRNLFASVPGPEVVVENDFSAEQFYLLFAPNGIEQNWSDRPKPQEPLSGEYNVILQEQQRLTQPVSFVSTEPSNEKFLKPLPENAFTQFKAPPGDFAPYIGAVEP
ncbi:MAG: hypothetical protein GXP27_14825 [Planctomycetes bacterium]|nr:hypothetical protein [Planctomycetota bacterium]